MLLITFIARNSLASFIGNYYLSAQNSVLTCLNYSFTMQLNIKLDKLCLNTPQADISLANTTLQWKLFPKISVQAINIATLNIEGKNGLFTNKTPKSNRFQNSTSQKQNSQIKTFKNSSSPNNTQKHKPATLKNLSFKEIPQYLQQVAQLNIPASIIIDNVNYYPYSLLSQTTIDKPRKVYSGNFSALDNILSFSINNQDIRLPGLFSATLSPKKTDFTATLNADLPFLLEFLGDHQFNLPLITNNGQIVSGHFNSQIQWQNEDLIIDSQLNNVAINFSLLDSSPFNALTNKQTTASISSKKTHSLTINTALAWKIHLSGKVIDINFTKHNKINVDYSDKKLITLFLAQNILPENTSLNISTILKDNPTKGLTILPIGNIKVDLTNTRLFMEELTFKTQNIDHPTQIKLTDISFNYGTQKTKGAIPSQAVFTFDSQLNMAALETYSNKPINIHAVGTIELNQRGWQLHLTPNSNIELINISLVDITSEKAELLAKSLVENKRNMLSIRKLQSQLYGDITVDKKGKTTIALTLDSQANLLQFSDNIQLDKLQFKSTINSDFEQVNVNAIIIADNVEVSTFTLNGQLAQPQFELSANELLLTDLLSLSIILPVPVELVDGKLNYHIKGQLTDLDNLLNNKVSALISLKNVSGEIDDIWLQELDWQQKLTLTNSQLKTLYPDKNNLYIESIELASPITNLSIKTQIKSKNNKFDLTAESINGKILGGSFYIPTLTWPMNSEHSVNVQLTNIDLEKVLELDKKQGIVVTGKISGELPITFDGNNVTIENGELHNISKGLIQVINNPAVEELKTSNSQLKLAFDALQNLHYHQLSSDVSMKDDGYMLLETVIKGRNPDLDNDVNLNLNLSYDLLGLLESMSITERLEQNIIKDLQKH